MSKSKQKAITDDEFLGNCMKLNETCSYSSCGKSVKIINLKCEFCNELFCTSHHLPEVHGCGREAKKSAAAPPKKIPNPVKMQELEKKMNKKLDKMKNERKKKKK